MLKCKKCLAWQKADSDDGTCRRRSPQLVINPQTGTLAAAWPATGKDDWCLDWEPMDERGYQS